jgi:excisionase family DNA binding protein
LGIVSWEVSRDTVERLIKKGELGAFKVGESWRIKKEEIDEYEKRNRPAK